MLSLIQYPLDVRGVDLGFMEDESLELIERCLRGIAEVSRGKHGLKLHRLPSKYAMYHDVDPLTQKVADQPTGARLSLVTAASQIEIVYRAILDATADGSYLSPPSTVTLTTGELEMSVAASNGDRRIWDGPVMAGIEEGSNSIATFDLPDTAEPRLVDLWLPHNCEIELVALRSNAPMTPAEMHLPRWVHYGSSISHSMEANEPTGVWPVVAARTLGYELFNLGLAGSANIEQFAARTIAELPADLITLKLGINPVNGRNMTRRTFVPAVHSFLDTVRASHPNTPILVISPIYCEGHEDTPGPSSPGPDGKFAGATALSHDWVQDLTLKVIREDLKTIVSRREDTTLHYLDGLELFSREDAYLMPDGLHPNAEGYRLIGERFAKNLEQLIR